MVNDDGCAPSLCSVRQRIRGLRRLHGDQDWLTVVGGATAAAYRLAGLTPAEFAALLRAETDRCGQLLIHLRRKANMRLRAGFEGHSGVITERDGVADLHLHFDGGRYTDAEDTPVLTLQRRLRTSLVVTGGLNAPVARLGLGELPRCVESGGGRSSGVDRQRCERGETTTVLLKRSYETLAAMPDDVADELGVERQRHLGHIPWLGYQGIDPASLASRPKVTPPPARSPVRLRLVGG